MAIKFDLRGFDALDKALAKKITAVTEGVDKELTATTIEWNAEQIQNTPVDTGRLRGGNQYDVSRPLNKTLENRVEYGPYIEFGTGGLVVVPPGLEDEAAQFKGAGIRQVNIRAQPFFFRPMLLGRKKLIERLRKIINE